MDQASPKIGVRYTENASVVILTDEKILEQEDIQALENSIMPMIEQNKGLNLIIDFSNVQFLSSAVLGLLTRISKRVHEPGGQLRLCRINSKIFEIFKITRLDKVFEIYETVKKADQSLA